MYACACERAREIKSAAFLQLSKSLRILQPLLDTHHLPHAEINVKSPQIVHMHTTTYAAKGKIINKISTKSYLSNGRANARQTPKALQTNRLCFVTHSNRK